MKENLLQREFSQTELGKLLNSRITPCKNRTMCISTPMLRNNISREVAES